MTKKQAALTARLVVAIVATVLFAVATTYWHFWVALPNGLAPPPTVWQWCEAVRYAWLPLPPPAPPRAAIRIVDARQFNTMIYHYQHDRNPSRNITAVALLPWKYVAAGGATRSSVAAISSSSPRSFELAA